MEVQEIVEKIKAQKKIIAEANEEIENLTNQLMDSQVEDFDWITVKRGADMIGVSVQLIYRKINEKVLDCKHIASKKLIRISQLEKLNDRMG